MFNKRQVQYATVRSMFTVFHMTVRH